MQQEEQPRRGMQRAAAGEASAGAVLKAAATTARCSERVLDAARLLGDVKGAMLVRYFQELQQER
jgi:hypothetical protein